MEETQESIANSVAPDTVLEQPVEQPVVTDPVATEQPKPPEAAPPEGVVPQEQYDKVLAAYRASMGRLAQIDKNFDQFREKIRSNPKTAVVAEAPRAPEPPAPIVPEAPRAPDPSLYDEYGQLRPGALELIEDRAVTKAEQRIADRLRQSEEVREEEEFRRAMVVDFDASLEVLNEYLASHGFKYVPVASVPGGRVDSHQIVALNGATPESVAEFAREFDEILGEALQMPFANIPGKSNAQTKQMIKDLEASRIRKSNQSRLQTQEQIDAAKREALGRLPRPIGSPVPSGNSLFGDEIRTAQKRVADNIAPDTVPLM